MEEAGPFRCRPSPRRPGEGGRKQGGGSGSERCGRRGRWKGQPRARGPPGGAPRTAMPEMTPSPPFALRPSFSLDRLTKPFLSCVLLSTREMFGGEHTNYRITPTPHSFSDTYIRDLLIEESSDLAEIAVVVTSADNHLTSSLLYWISDPGPEGESTKLTRPKIAPPTYCPPSQREPYCHVFHGPTILYWVPNPERILHYTNTTNFNWYLAYGYRCTMWVPGKTSGCRAWYVTREKSVVATTRPLIDILRQDSDYYDIKIPK
ncbi:hypothetical protein BHE74_00047652 [Ensete ventricosum]|nr:hypothetical protein BHE74_00047652 [Ensete ventricosum]